MKDKKKNKSLLLNSSNVSIMRRNSNSNKSPAPYTIIKSKGGKEVPTAVPFGSNEVDEPEINLTVVNALQATEQRKALQTAERRKALQADERRKASEALLVEKVLNGGLRLQFKVLEEIILALKKTSLENFAVFNESFTEHRPSRREQCKPGKLKSKAIRINIVEDSNIYTNLSRDFMLDVIRKESRAISVLCGRVAELFKVLTLFTEFCKNIYLHLKIIVESQPVTEEPFKITDESFEVPASNVEQLLRYNTRLPMDLIKKYKCAKLFYDFSTEFYLVLFLNMFIDHESGYHLRKSDVTYLQDLVRFLELYIPLLVEFTGFVSKLNGETEKPFDEWQKLYRGFQKGQKKLFSKSKFCDLTCDANFAVQLNSIVDAFIEDVSSELEVL